MKPAALLRMLAVAAIVGSPAARALEGAPDAIIKGLTQEVIAAIREDAGKPNGSTAKVTELVETRILPIFDFSHMTQIAVARNWRLASPGQQAQLTTEFRTLLVRTYSTALSSYRDQTFEFKALHAASGDDAASVKTVVRRSGTAPVTMDYDMERTSSGWKVYDVKIDGMSLITTYRDAFADKVREGGIDGLIRSLVDKNRQGDARYRTRQTGDFYVPVLFQGFLQGLGATSYLSHAR
jgi:phospholipid transport system substrate-binding protein